MRYCIGDIHGCFKTLNKLVNQITSNDSNAQLYFIGDYIDRGPDSKSVLDFLRVLRNQDLLAGAIIGNHEDMLIKAFESKAIFMNSTWYNNGAKYTIQSFGFKYNFNSTVNEIVPIHYFNQLCVLPSFIVLDDYILVHAGLNFKIDDPFDDIEHMLWTRFENYDHAKINGKKIIHGHTPMAFDKIKIKNSNIINIDTGCVFINLPNLGKLTAINLDTLDLLHVENIDYN